MRAVEHGHLMVCKKPMKKTLMSDIENSLYNKKLFLKNSLIATAGNPPAIFERLYAIIRVNSILLLSEPRSGRNRNKTETCKKQMPDL